MAVKTLTVADLTTFGTFTAADPETATAAADGFEATIKGDFIVLVYNSSADTAYDVTIKKGNAMQGVADVARADVAFGTYWLYRGQVGQFKNVSGTNKGKVLIVPENAALKVKVFQV